MLTAKVAQSSVPTANSFNNENERVPGAGKIVKVLITKRAGFARGYTIRIIRITLYKCIQNNNDNYNMSIIVIIKIIIKKITTITCKGPNAMSLCFS